MTADYQTFAELEKKFKTERTQKAELYQTIKQRLTENNFDKDLYSLTKFLEKNPNFIDHCNKLQDKINEQRAVLLVLDDAKLLWDIHKYFPILYALNNLGESIYRTTIKEILNALLDREVSDALPKRLAQNFILISHLFSGDNRLTSLSDSVMGLIEPLIFSKKIVFTSHTTKASFSEVKEDIKYRLKQFYSLEMQQTFLRHVAPMFLQTKETKESLWL